MNTYPRFVGVHMLPVGTCYCYIVLIVMLPLRFIGAEGLSEMDADLLMVALSAPMLVVPMLVASLTRWMSAGALSGIGFLVAPQAPLHLTPRNQSREVRRPCLLSSL